MNSGFNSSKLQEDLHDLGQFLKGFLRSFGKPAKKPGEPSLGFREEQTIRFRLMLVEMGISKIIRIVIFLVVTLLVFVPLLVWTSGVLQVFIAFVLLSYGTWLFMDHLVVDKKPVNAVAGYLVAIHERRLSAQESIGGAISSALNSVAPGGPSTDKK